MKVWSSVAPSPPSAQMRVSSTQLRSFKCYITRGNGSALFPIILFCHSHIICSDRKAKHKRTSLRCELKCLMFVGFCIVGVCQPRVTGTVGAEPFSAKLRYTGTENTDYPNLIKVTITMPHIDGKNSMSSTSCVNSKAA